MAQTNNANNKNIKKKKTDIGVVILAILLLIGIVYAFYKLTETTPTQINYTELTELVDNDGTGDATITSAYASQVEDSDYLTLYFYAETEDTDGNTTSTYYDCVITYDELNELQTTYSVSITVNPTTTSVWLTLLVDFIPIILMVLLFLWFMKANTNSKAMDFGKSTAHLARGKTVTFKDVAGCEEEKQELVEIVDFLKNPKKYVEIGARIPKGVLLSGNPGTGKTLLAKAVAGEAGVPFFSISGSDFVEMFVGVGASRVRDLFKQAKQNAPCIIFIDEIDAVGRQRGAGMGGGHDEREQTLNQLLVEMDGFTTNIGIIVMAATNRPDVLDPALLRPGRFDRQITIALPDVNGRRAILEVHARNKKFDKNVNFDDIAHRIPGFSGADIENLLNEAALLAARDNRKVINKFDIDEATDRVMMGPAKKSHRMTDQERNRVAHHEAGHAVIGLKLEHSNVVQKVTIIPRGQAGGYALMLPEEETYLSTKRDLLERITGFLGGRVAEEIIFDEVSTGASNDFQQATKIARSMVTEYGMSELGPVTYEKPQGSIFLGRDYLKDKDFSDQIALEIDRATRNIIDSCYTDATNCIKENKLLLLTIADYLKKIETLTKQDIDEINTTGHLKWYDDQQAAKAAKADSSTTDSSSNTDEVVNTVEEKNDSSTTTTVDNPITNDDDTTK